MSSGGCGTDQPLKPAPEKRDNSLDGATPSPVLRHTLGGTS
jgi:hypothetical protein